MGAGHLNLLTDLLLCKIAMEGGACVFRRKILTLLLASEHGPNGARRTGRILKSTLR
jgi:hypothetical protein